MQPNASYNARMRRISPLRPRAGLLLTLAFALVFHLGCGGQEPDVKQAVQISDVVTGWFDAGIVNGQNKLVPTIAFKAKNSASQKITYVSFNAVFRVVNDPEELGSAMLKGLDGKGLEPGATSETFVARSQLGYTSPAPRLDMLQHSQFRDAQVEVFAKHGSTGWVKLGEYKIQRQLLTK
jgi:hypothetical protein